MLPCFFNKMSSDKNFYKAEDDYYINSIKENIENILNTRRNKNLIEFSFYTNLKTSIYTYGIDTPINLTVDNNIETNSFFKDVKLTVEKFEPRISGVNIFKTNNKNGSKCFFCIEAVVKSSYGNQKISFDTILDIEKFNWKLE